ncbi:hypothetical protein [Cellvibrio sp. OA-2007]|uniref:hypothetical protein n=1 Tax=Cellvibrio sp. OA-2007 TaxID=529823 RepID=UPI000784A1E2|nr:hypothetical protein [Cellvibrio sp. OA-2007]
MGSNMDQEIEALFARIQSPQTARRFKLLRSATTEELARTFRPEKTELPKQEELLGFLSDSKLQTP